jgi:hypothetical protein
VSRETCHDVWMASFSRLHDFYSFPGFLPSANIRGIFGDPYAVVISLRRRRKKRPADGVAPVTAVFTINHLGEYATSIAAAGVSSWSFSSDASTVAGAEL